MEFACLPTDFMPAHEARWDAEMCLAQMKFADSDKGFKTALRTVAFSNNELMQRRPFANEVGVTKRFAFDSVLASADNGVPN